MSYNKVILLGNITRKPEVRYTQAGHAICKFGLACNRKYKLADGTWKEDVTFVEITFFGKRGEALARFHDKGQPIFLEGELRLDQWEDKNTGEKRQKLHVVGNEWCFAGGGNRSGQPGAHAGAQDHEWESASTQAQPPQQQQGSLYGSGAHQGAQGLDIDDTPF